MDLKKKKEIMKISNVRCKLASSLTLLAPMYLLCFLMQLKLKLYNNLSAQRVIYKLAADS